MGTTPQARRPALRRGRSVRAGGEAGGRSRGARIALIVVGVIAAILAFGLLAGGCALVGVDQALRDDDGFVMSPDEDFRTPTYAIVSERAELDTEGAEWALDAFLGTVRVRAESRSDREIFVGIGREQAVTAYLRGVEHIVTDLDDDPEYEQQAARRGRRPRRVSGSRRPPARASRRSSGSPRTATGVSCS